MKEVLLLLLGALLAWFVQEYRLWRMRRASETERLRSQETAQTALLDKGRAEASAAQLQIHLETAAKDFAQQKQSLESKLEQEQSKVLELSRDVERIQSDRKNLEQRLKEQQTEIENLHQRLQAEFKNLANEIFDDKSRRFTQQNQENILQLLTPVRESLESYQKRLQETERQQADVLGHLRQQIESLMSGSAALSRETEQLRSLLKSNHARGRWGEETLRRVVEAAGMSRHCDFSEQVVENDSKPDLVVYLPEGRKIIVDSKVPSLDLLRELDSPDPAMRQSAIERHAQVVRETVQRLAAREYQRQFEGALDYVVLFLPAESIFSAALEGDGDLIVKAARQQIVIATPASLIALLRAVSLSWKHYQQTQEIREIHTEAKNLYTRVVTFLEHFEDIRSGLAQACKGLQKALSSYNSRVRPSGEKLLELGIDSGGKQMPAIEDAPTVGEKPSV